MEEIGNKIVSIDKIIEISNYLEELKNKYIDLMEEERKQLKDITYHERRYKYDGQNPVIEYRIFFKDGKDITETDKEWFFNMIKNISIINEIELQFKLYVSCNYENINNIIFKNINASIDFDAKSETSDIIKIRVSADSFEQEANEIRNKISTMINSCESRYNKTIKNKNVRIQSFCISVGILLSYIAYLVLIINKEKLPQILIEAINNKNFVLIGQWIIAIVFGNVFGYGIIHSIYKLILPALKYKGYDSSSYKSIYKEDIEEYIKHSEIQIGRFSKAQNKRDLIEKIYNITLKIIILQIVISSILYLILK